MIEWYIISITKEETIMIMLSVGLTIGGAFVRPRRLGDQMGRGIGSGGGGGVVEAAVVHGCGSRVF